MGASPGPASLRPSLRSALARRPVPPSTLHPLRPSLVRPGVWVLPGEAGSAAGQRGVRGSGECGRAGEPETQRLGLGEAGLLVRGLGLLRVGDSHRRVPFPWPHKIGPGSLPKIGPKGGLGVVSRASLLAAPPPGLRSAPMLVSVRFSLAWRAAPPPLGPAPLVVFASCRRREGMASREGGLRAVFAACRVSACPAPPSRRSLRSLGAGVAA